MCVTPISFSTTCRLVSGSKKSATYFKEISTDLSTSISCGRGRLFEPDSKGHVEKAIGVTHIEIKHPACCTATKKFFKRTFDSAGENHCFHGLVLEITPAETTKCFNIL